MADGGKGYVVVGAHLVSVAIEKFDAGSYGACLDVIDVLDHPGECCFDTVAISVLVTPKGVIEAKLISLGRRGARDFPSQRNHFAGYPP